MTSLYDVSIPVMTTVVNTLSNILKKGEQYVKENNISEADLLDSRIYEDMFPLSSQVLVVVSTIRKTIDKLTGSTLPPVQGLNGSNGETLAKLHQFIEQTLRDLSAVNRETVEEKGNTEVIFNVGPHMVKKATLAEFIHGYTVPYIYFHLNIAYAILRQNGVPLGKLDYLDAFIHEYFQDA
ncbi:hypothetical protein SUNI508_06350 [Seiridium unicorne]|uniref:DUF1993 domain-containing protein n=1 Tax=Seiridium unicorne TaxID=138068 RepID=A0ABR2V102_9PEZI